VFAIPRFTIRASYIVQSAYVTYFYESIGAKLTYIAAYVAIARSFDVITDPLMGWLSDNTHTRFGRRKPYMGVGSLLYNLCLLLLLMPPRSLEHPAVSHWFGFTYTAFYLFDTFCSIPYYAFGMEMTNDFSERDQLWYWNQLSGAMGTLVGMGLPAALTAVLTGNLYTVFMLTGVVFASVHLLGMGSNVALVAEKPPDVYNTVEGPKEGSSSKAQSSEENATAEPNSAPFVVNLLRCARNGPFDFIIKSYFLDYLALGMVSAMTPFYVGYVLLRPKGGNVDDTDLTVVTIGILAVCVFLSAFLSVPVWERIAARFGKYEAWIYYSIWNAVTCPFFAACGTNKTAAYVVAAFNGSAFGGQFLLDSIVNDVAEYDTMLHGDSIEGCLVAIQTFVPKIVLVASMSLPFAVIAAMGFKGSACVTGEDQCDGDLRAPEPQSETIQWAILTFFCILPTIAALLSIYFKLQYPIKTPAVAQAISEARAAHGRGEASVDPITSKAVGPLCLSRLADPRQRTALMALAHFPEATVREYGRRGRDPSFLVFGVTRNFHLSLVALVLCLVGAGSTFSFLDTDAIAWIPIICCVASGALLVFVYIFQQVSHHEIVGGLRVALVLLV
jgi:Na+/melibiose symporter-like transporter